MENESQNFNDGLWLKKLFKNGEVSMNEFLISPIYFYDVYHSAIYLRNDRTIGYF